MKKHKKVWAVIIILIIAFLMYASFFGIYKYNENGEKISILSNYKIGMDFGSKRVITATPNNETVKTIYDSEGNVVEEEEGKEYTEEAGYKIEENKINPESIMTEENYKKSKDIIEERLQGYEIPQYSVELNEITGEIKIEIPEDENADEVESIIKKSGSLIMLDGQTFETVFDSSYLESAKVMYGQSEVEKAVYLQLAFNEEGTNKLEELSKIYVETTEEQTNEEGEIETVTNSKSVWVILNGAFLGQTVIPNILYDNKIILTFGTSNNIQDLQTPQEEAQKEAILLNSGTMQIMYDFTNEVIETSITEKSANMYVAGITAVFGLAYIYFVIRFRGRGFISMYLQIGYLAFLLLLLRITNVIITLEGMASIIISVLLEYVFMYIYLGKLEDKAGDTYKKVNLEYFLYTIPLCVISIIFSFAKQSFINSFGMILFWGIITIYLYNYIFAKFIIENISRRSK